jgi:hypothetical protein
MKRFLISTAIVIALAAPASAQSFRKPAAEPTPAAQPQTAPVPTAPVQTAPAAAPSPAAPTAAPVAAPAETEFEKRMREAREAAEMTERAKTFNALVDDRLAIGALNDEQAQKTKKTAVSSVEVEAMREIRNREVAAWTQSPDHKKAMETMKSRASEFQPIINAAIARGGWLTTAEIARISAQSVAKAAAPAEAPKQPAPARKPATPVIVAEGAIDRIETTSRIQVAGKWITLANVVGTNNPTALRQAGDFAWELGALRCTGTVAAAECVAGGKNVAAEFVKKNWAQLAANAPANFVNAAR